ncbi:MAG TPA: phosphoribosylformylglycinamidine synthase subunit PurS [Enteractinococcus helveticum]|uniref:Phosphoribosylformylglycinamidine synthase subunit PurS n=1 Tax=Enteractinococcus helveticum TaxID=1837282 RepID=A0A921KA72_9MICC|nr:phosphoribosylformylglycinamidine synthase subunit PurS [Enteractinococcus helveticum]HJF15864.1 phosphoribosylformylglycinamidine synthase subunit PurS [Enteractinococcus helveticum]
MPTIVVEVMPKPEVLDPQGKAIDARLPELGFHEFSSVRQGKRFELTVDGEATAEVLDRAKQLAAQLLANPSTEYIAKVEVAK